MLAWENLTRKSEVVLKSLKFEGFQFEVVQ